MATRRERILKKAEKLVQRGRLEAAIDELKKVLEETPDDTRTLNRVGDLYARLSRVDEAVDLFSKAAERFTNEGFFVKAIAIYKKILRLDPTRMPIYDSLAELYRHQGLTNEAKAQYQVVADYYEKAEDIAAVVAVYEKLVELDLSDPEMRIRLGDLLTSADRAGEAVEEYREAASSLFDAGESDSGLFVLQRAIEADPDNLEFVMQTVLELQSARESSIVERFVEAAIARNPEAAQARELLESVSLPAEAATAEEAEAEAEAVEVVEDAAEAVEAPAEEIGEEEIAALEELAAAPEAEPEPVATESDVEFEIELDAFEGAMAEAAEPEPEPPPVEAPPEPDVDEILIEADALASYGLGEKASERLHRVLGMEPGHLGAFRRLIAIEADAQREAEVVQLAGQAAAAALESGNAVAWREIASDLKQRGYRFEGTRIMPPPPPSVEVPAELFVDAPETVETSEPAEETPDAEVVVEPAETAVDTIGPEEREVEEPVSEEAPPAEAPVAAGAEAAGEGDFFDLGAELAQELEGMEEEIAETEGDIEGQTIEEIVEGFKRGMAEVLSPEAYDTHYSLGVAYREMGLVDEAIGEFQLAAKDPRYLVECCSLLGQSFQEKDFADLAIKWYRKGLDSPFITEEETWGLLYEMGNLHLTSGDRDAARDAFTEIYGANSNFRDVVAKLEELRDD